MLNDGLFLVALLAASVAVVAACLWAAQAVSVTSEPGAGGPARTVLGLVALGATVSLMTGAIPGTGLLNPIAAMATFGCAILSFLTIAGAQRTPAVAKRAAPARTAEQARKAA
ncbi:MAG TPA: hypothetical protein VD971_07820 [Phycisphaerales bacterium]|nr:hypothetical protein [Phycisphaerales bacterium]